MTKTMIFTPIVLFVNLLLVGSSTFMTIILTQDSLLPLPSTTIGNAFAQSVEHVEEGEKEREGEENIRSSLELNDKGKENDNNDGKEQEQVENEEEEDNDVGGPISSSDTQQEEEVVHNRPPTADAGSDQEVNEGEEISLSAKDSADDDGDTLTFSWRQLMSGNDNIALELKDSKSSKLEFIAPDIGKHESDDDDTKKIILQLEITVTDGEFEDKDIVKITVTANEITDVSEKLQDNAKENRDNNEQGSKANRSKIDSSEPDHLEIEGISKPSNRLANAIAAPSLTMWGFRNNSEHNLQNETTVTNNNDDNEKEQHRGAYEILNQETTNSTSETGPEIPPSLLLSFTCGPMPLNMTQGSTTSFVCNIKNPTMYDIDLTIRCSGLEEAGIECLVGENYIYAIVSVDRMSDKTFPMTITTDHSPPPAIGSYAFLITADCDTDSCRKAIDGTTTGSKSTS